MYLLYAATTAGFSLLHGPHHEAQKSIKTNCPFKEESFISFPSGLLNANSGALTPIAGPPCCLKIKPAVTKTITDNMMVTLNFFIVFIILIYYYK